MNPYLLNTLQRHLHTTLVACRSVHLGKEIGDIVPRMPVKTGLQPLLIEVMGNQANGTAKNEETVKDTNLRAISDIQREVRVYSAYPQIFLGFFSGEGTAIPDEVDEANSNGTVNVQDQIVLLAGRNGLHSKGVIEQLVRGEMLQDKFLHQLHTKIGIVPRLDFVANTRNCSLLVQVRNIPGLDY